MQDESVIGLHRKDSVFERDRSHDSISLSLWRLG